MIVGSPGGGSSERRCYYHSREACRCGGGVSSARRLCEQCIAQERGQRRTFRRAKVSLSSPRGRRTDGIGSRRCAFPAKPPWRTSSAPKSTLPRPCEC